MKRLTLLRHAKSDLKSPTSPDFDRPLSLRGFDEASEMGRRLAAMRLAPDALISSPAARAWSTAQVIASALGCGADTIFRERAIYEAEPEDLLSVVRELRSSWEHVMILGHNPGLSDLAQRLASDPLEDLPTCGVVSLEFEVDGWPGVEETPGRVLLFDAPA